MGVFWLCFGFAGQALFGSRFLVQWIASERRGQSYFPRLFWYLSISGSLVLLVYAVHLGDPPFIAGQGTGVIIYLRNLILLRRNRGTAGAGLTPSGGS